ncbi:methyltransferase domain-containing protein [Antrihabitans sp. YC2-6]|nr:methyltransferase domain-containing protein [Antrihabitans sp. YC2-6]
MSSVDGALDRARILLRPAAQAARAASNEGFIDLIGPVEAPQPTAAQRAMNSKFVAAIYERLWRPVGVAALGFYGLSGMDERAKAVKDLRLRDDKKVLDVACGPGNFTKSLGAALSDQGIAIGFDISRPMLLQAARENRSGTAAYVRGDARNLPFDDGTFDAVCCYAALYLVPEPLTVVVELIRVLAPGGRIAIMTSYTREHPLISTPLTLGARTVGVRMFDRTTFTDIFADAGLTEIEQEIHGVAQFVTATKPAG